MKNNLLRLSGIAAVAVLLSTSVFAQQNDRRNGDDDVLIITKKGLKDGRIVIDVRNGEVTVNGKSIDDYKDGDLTIIRRGNSRSGNARVSPFRVESPTWNSGDNPKWNSGDNPKWNSGSGNSNGNVYESRAVGYLGVVTEKTDDGAKITSIVQNSPADRSGLKEGDVITHIDEDRIDDHDDLSRSIRKHKPGEKINVTVERNGNERQVVATLGVTGGTTVFSAPKAQGFNTLPDVKEFKSMPDVKEYKLDNDLFRSYSYSGTRVRLGIRAQDTEDGRGAKVLSVDNNSPADMAGIREGDIITQFQGLNVADADDLVAAARAVKDQSSMTVRLQRDGRSQTVEVKVAKKLKTTNL